LKKVKTFAMIVLLTAAILNTMIFGGFFIIPVVESQEFPSDYPLVYVYPELVRGNVGDTFTIGVVVYNLTNKYIDDPALSGQKIYLGNLYGFDIQLTWDPDVIQYVSHEVTVPVEDYSGEIPPANYSGILHEPYLKVVEIVDENGNIPGANTTDVKAWFSYASQLPAEAFNGNGTFFTMTFRVVKQSESPIKLEAVTLAGNVTDNPYIGQSGVTGKWLNPPRSGVFRAYGVPVVDFEFAPDMGVVDKLVNFTASVQENVTNIATYMWDFGDGTVKNTTVPTVSHVYNTSGEYTVKLKVLDSSDPQIESGWVKKAIKIADSRDLAVSEVTVSQTSVRPNNTFTVKAKIENLGSPRYGENCSVKVYYNISNIDWLNPEAASWTLINHTRKVLEKEWEFLNFEFNSSLLPQLEAYYYFMVNVSGIPRGYEAATDNNLAFSQTALEYTEEIKHNPTITQFKFGYKLVETFKTPVLEGENTTIKVTVKNMGNAKDTINVTIFVDGSQKKDWQAEMKINEEKSFEWQQRMDRGDHNITAVTSAGNITNTKQGIVKVIKPPQIIVNATTTSPGVNEEVLFNASNTIHEDANITEFVWKVYKPGDDPTRSSPVKTVRGSDAKTFNYTFTESGEWTVVLDIFDDYGISYDSNRAKTSAYRKELTIAVGGGMPLEWLIAIAVAVIVVILILFLIIRKRRTQT